MFVNMLQRSSRLLDLLQSLLCFYLVLKVQSVAPGDEDQLCEDLRRNGSAPIADYSANMSILMDSYNYQNLLPDHLGAVWQEVDNDETNDTGITTNWVQSSNSPCNQVVQVCGFTAGPQDNWLITQLINRTVKGTHLPRVSVLIELEQQDCNITLNCTRTFNTHVYETSSVDSAAARNVNNYRQVERVSPIPGNRVNETVTIDFNTDHSSFYFAIQDESTCIIVTRVIVFYIVCLAQRVNMIRYPLTIAPVSGSISVSASCIVNAEPIGDPPVINCSSDGSWGPPSSFCRCTSGAVNVSGVCESNSNSSIVGVLVVCTLTVLLNIIVIVTIILCYQAYRLRAAPSPSSDVVELSRYNINRHESASSIMNPQRVNNRSRNPGITDDENTLLITHLQRAPVIPMSGPQVHNIQMIDSPEQDTQCSNDWIQGSRVLMDRTAYFSAAEKNVGVPFLDHQLLECNCNGGEYTNVDHDITLRIPEGALAEGEKIHFEVGVAMYGPFIFPENTQPISPILWLCILEEDVELKKPFQVVLPHYLTGLSKERVQYHQVGFAKASHNDYTFVDDQITYKFLASEAEPLLASSGYRNYGVLVSKHCCFYCLKANKTKELATDIGYCLTRIESSISPQRNEVYFCATFFLDTCLRSLKEQFPHKDYNMSRFVAFKFKDGREPLQLTVPAEHNECVIALDPAKGKIKPSDVDFWTETFPNLQLKHEHRMYPPRVKITITFRNPDSIIKLPIKFTGHVDSDELDMEITLPLIGLSLSSPLSSYSGSHSDHSSHTIICDKPKLKDVLKILLPLASRWKTIGALLGAEPGVLAKIKHDEQEADDRLQEVISWWLKQVDPSPTWKALADVLETLDPQIASKIRQQCIDI